MTKKMLVKTESVDMTWGRGEFWGRTGEERESWCKETNVNESFHQKHKSLFFFFFKSNQTSIQLLDTQTLTNTHTQTSWKTPSTPSCDISEERPRNCVQGNCG